MQKLRPYLLPGLTGFHLFLLVLAVWIGPIAHAKYPTRLELVTVSAFTVITWSSMCLAAFWASFGPEPALLRIPGCAALAALAWVTRLLVEFKADAGAVGVGTIEGHRQIVDMGEYLRPLFGWPVVVLLLLCLRALPFLQWRVVMVPTPSKSSYLTGAQYSLTRGILVAVATFGGALVLLKDIFPWHALPLHLDAVFYFAEASAETAVSAALLIMFCVSITLTRLADWLFYRRRWTLPLFATIVSVTAISVFVFYQTRDGMYRNLAGKLSLSTGGSVEITLGVLLLILALIAQPIVPLLLMGLAGYRLKSKSQVSPCSGNSVPLSVSELSREASLTRWMDPIRRVHILALAAVIVFLVALVPTGIMLDHEITRHTRFRVNGSGAITRVRIRVVTDRTLRAIGRLSHLTQLSFWELPPSSDAGLVHLKGLTSLQDLNLYFTQVTDAGLVHLKGMTKLTNLTLYNTQVTDAGLVHLKGLTNLQELHLGGEKITDKGLVHLKALTSLQKLSVSHTQVTDAGLVQLTGMNLKYLVIPKEARTDIGLKHYLPALERPTRLSFVGWEITDVGLASLSGLNLQKLTIPKLVQTDLGLKHYLAALKPTTFLKLAGWQITDAGLVHLKRLPNLQKLSLADTQVTDAGLVHLRRLSNLTYVNLYGTKVTGTGIVHLKELTNLDELDLRNTQFTDTGLVHLKGLTSLTSLNLSGTQITDAELLHLQGMTKLQWLHLKRTQITDAGVAELQKALPNCKISN